MSPESFSYVLFFLKKSQNPSLKEFNCSEALVGATQRPAKLSTAYVSLRSWQKQG